MDPIDMADISQSLVMLRLAKHFVSEIESQVILHD